MNRRDLHRLAKTRIKEAEVLFKNDCYEGAYYLAGYSIECAFKACIAKQIKEHDFPDLSLIRNSYTHDLGKLLGLSGLKDKHQKKADQDSDFELNWAVVKDWSEQERYTPAINKQRTRDLIEAITDDKTGILTWLKKWW